MPSRLDALRDAVIAACHALGCTPNELVGWPSLDAERRALEERLDDIRIARLADYPSDDKSTSEAVAIAYVAPEPPPPEPRQAADPTRPRRGMSPERDARIREMHEAGAPLEQIATTVGMTMQGVSQAAKRMRLPPRRRGRRAGT
jgi:hypothetical protein